VIVGLEEVVTAADIRGGRVVEELGVSDGADIDYTKAQGLEEAMIPLQLMYRYQPLRCVHRSCSPPISLILCVVGFHVLDVDARCRCNFNIPLLFTRNSGPMNQLYDQNWKGKGCLRCLDLMAKSLSIINPKFSHFLAMIDPRHVAFG